MSTRRYELLVRTAPGDIFEASVLGIANCVAEGRTREEAIAKARDSLLEKLAGGEIVTVDIESDDAPPGPDSNVWRAEAGRLRDDPTFDDFLAQIEAERARANSDEPSQ